MVVRSSISHVIRLLTGGLLAFAGAVSAQPAGGVFRCTDANGNVEYRNVGNTQGCKRVETDAVNTVPFPRQPAKAAEPRGSARVDAGAQRGRDNDRKRILQGLMSKLQKPLTEQFGAPADQVVIQHVLAVRVIFPRNTFRLSLS